MSKKSKSKSSREKCSDALQKAAGPQPDQSQQLSPGDEQSYQDCHEAVVRLETGMLAGARALRNIRDGQLYRYGGFENFRDYCERHLGKSHAYGLIKFIDIRDDLSAIVDESELPTHEAQTRPLNKVPSGDRPTVWKLALQHANGHVTMQIVKKARDEFWAAAAIRGSAHGGDGSLPEGAVTVSRKVEFGVKPLLRTSTIEFLQKRADERRVKISVVIGEMIESAAAKEIDRNGKVAQTAENADWLPTMREQVGGL